MLFTSKKKKRTKILGNMVHFNNIYLPTQEQEQEQEQLFIYKHRNVFHFNKNKQYEFFFFEQDLIEAIHQTYCEQ